jgi:hypothetical protein
MPKGDHRALSITQHNVAPPSLAGSPSYPHSWNTLRSLRRHTARAEQANKYLRARVLEAVTFTALAEARINAARAITDLGALREICSAQFLKGRRQRASDLLVHDLECQAKEIHARVSVAIARRHQAAFPDPDPPTPAASSEHQGLTPTEVDEILASLPEVSDATRETLIELLKARLEEK